jgi:hypothetical protein
MKSEIIFEVTEAEEGGYCASALGCGITTQGETLEELRAMVRDAVDCYYWNSAGGYPPCGAVRSRFAGAAAPVGESCRTGTAP